MAACSASFWDAALWPICTHVYCYLPQTQVKIKSLKIKTKNLMCPVPLPPHTQRCFDCVSVAGHSSGMGSALSVVTSTTQNSRDYNMQCNKSWACKYSASTSTERMCRAQLCSAGLETEASITASPQAVVGYCATWLGLLWCHQVTGTFQLLCNLVHVLLCWQKPVTADGCRPFEAMLTWHKMGQFEQSTAALYRHHEPSFKAVSIIPCRSFPACNGVVYSVARKVTLSSHGCFPLLFKKRLYLFMLPQARLVNVHSPHPWCPSGCWPAFTFCSGREKCVLGSFK